MTTYDGLKDFKEEIAKAAITMEMTHAPFNTGNAESGFTLHWTTPDYPPVKGPTGDMEFTFTDDKGSSNTFVANPWEDVYKPWIDRIDQAFEGWIDVNDPHTTFEAPLTAMFDAITLLTFTPTKGSAEEPPFTAQTELNTAIDEIDVMTNTGVGDTVETFRKYYGAARLETAIANQRNAMLALATALLLEQHVMKKLRDDVVKIADNAKSAFEHSSKGPTALTVLKAIGEIALGTLPGLGPITGAIEKGVKVTGAVSSLIPAQPGGQDPVPLQGSTADDVYSNLLRALGALSTELYDAEKAIHNGPIEGMMDAIYKGRDDYHIHHELGLAPEVEKLPAGSIDVDPGTMRKIGTYWLPAVADQLGRSAARMNAGAGASPWARPPRISGYGSHGPYESWKELHDVVDSLATSSAAELLAAGPKLVAAAGGIQGADEDSYHTSEETKKQVEGAPTGWNPSAQAPEDAEPPDQQDPSER